MDPHAEKYYNVSPYAYCHNNPLNRIDPDGKDDKNGIKTEINPTNGVPTSAQSTTGGNTPDIKESVPASTNYVLKDALKTEKSTDKNAQLSQTDKMIVTELDKKTSGNPLVQATVLGVTGAVALPTLVTAGGTALTVTESSVALSIGGGVVEGVVKTVIQAPNDFYIIPIPLSQVTSDATQAFMYFTIPTTRK
jgi:hypothetical protein